jgi:2-dehydro-3-deoxyphosphogluconate aldolase / (4S)-4-hydroxy-2-oxoglutarate aldolase
VKQENMDSRTKIIEQIKSDGLLPLYFNADAEQSLAILKALYEGGVRVVEYTNRGKQAIRNFAFMKKQADQFPELLLGAGTIKDASAANQFIQAGADFLVSPGIPEDVFDVAYEEKILWIPGCMTVTEIMRAENFGLSFVKIFPGNLLGPAFVQSILEIFPDISFMPTGGVEVEEDNLRGWFNVGVSAVGMGSKMITKKMMEQKQYKKISAAAKEALKIIRDVRK